MPQMPKVNILCPKERVFVGWVSCQTAHFTLICIDWIAAILMLDNYSGLPQMMESWKHGDGDRALAVTEYYRMLGKGTDGGAALNLHLEVA